MTFIPIYDFSTNHNIRKYEEMVRKDAATVIANISVSDESVIMSTKGTIAIRNTSIVNPVIRTVIESNYLRKRFTSVLTMEEHLHFQSLLAMDYSDLTCKTIKVFNDFIVHNGIKHGTKRFKDHANVCILRLEGIRQPAVDFAIGKDLHWPSKFHYLRPLLVLDRPEFASYETTDQIIRTLLGVSRIPEDYKVVDLEHILVKNKLKDSVIQEFDDYVSFRINHPTKGFKEAGTPDFCKWGTRPNARTASFGPNGQNKLVTASFEAAVLIQNELYKPFSQLCTLTGNIPFLEYVNRLGADYKEKYILQNKINQSLPKEERPFDIISRTTPKGKRRNSKFKSRQLSKLRKDSSRVVPIENTTRVGKDTIDSREKRISKHITMYSNPSQGSLRTITAVPDSGNKSRTIAISDIWTQLLLTPFEEKLIQFLDKMFKNVSSFHNHQLGFRKLQINLKPGTKSIDLVSWTDYLSAILQEIVVKHLFNKEIARNWYQLVVSCDWDSKNHDKPIRYGTGQGMGTKGSFLIASITDHFISELLLTKYYPDKVRTNPIETLYSRVGDDIWIWDPEDLISKALVNDYKLKVNLGKSKSATDINLCAEYVSMNINYGYNVSRISIRNILDTRKNIINIIPLIFHLKERSNVDIFLLLEKFWNEQLFKPRTWSNLYKFLSFEVVDPKVKEYKRDLHEALFKLNKIHGFSEMGDLPYSFIKNHEKKDHLLLLLQLYSLSEDAKEIKSSIMKIRNIPQGLSTHWTEHMVKVTRDSTVWDTRLQLHELITWCQYVDSSDCLDNLDPGTIVFRILESETLETAFEQLYHYRYKLTEARSELTFQNIDRLSPAFVERSKTLNFMNVCNKLVITDIDEFTVFGIKDEELFIDEFLYNNLSKDIAELNTLLFLGKASTDPAKGIRIPK